MQLIPLASVPNQTLQIVLGGQNCAIELRTFDGFAASDTVSLSSPMEWLGFSLSVSGEQITTTQNCLNQRRLLRNRQYLGFAGDFVFVDTQGEDNPQYSGLGNRWQLVYIEAADL